VNIQQQLQPLIAPVAAGGGIVAGISAALIGLYQVADCLAYKTRQGQCDGVVTTAVPAIVAGAGSIAGAVGGLWTFNPSLRGARRSEDEPTGTDRDEHGRFRRRQP